MAADSTRDQLDVLQREQISHYAHLAELYRQQAQNLRQLGRIAWVLLVCSLVLVSLSVEHLLLLLRVWQGGR